MLLKILKELTCGADGFDDGVPEYVALWLDYARNVSKAVWGVEDAKKFWVGGFQESTCFEVNSTCYTVQSILEQGIKDSGLAKTASTHAVRGYRHHHEISHHVDNVTSTWDRLGPRGWVHSSS